MATTDPGIEPERNISRLGSLVSTKKRLGLTLGTAGVAMALLLGARTDDATPTATGGDGAEGTESGTESGGEGSEGSEGGGLGEAAEGGTGQGEANETHNGNGEANEGGVVNLLAPGDTYDETINGARLILNFDAAANEFVGSVENTTNGPLTRARVEIHLSNGTELGPTTPTDLTAGQTLPLTLTSTTAPFDTWSAHPEVGAAEAGGDGAEGGEGGSGEGGGEGSASGATTLVSTGVSRGIHTSQPLAPDQAYAGNLNGLEVAVSYDATADTFVGRVKNEANVGLCNTRLAVNLDGQTGPETVRIPALDQRGRAEFILNAGPGAFRLGTSRPTRSPAPQ